MRKKRKSSEEVAELKELARANGITFETAYSRSKRLGISIRDAASMPNARQKYEFNGEILTVGEIASSIGISVQTIYSRFHRGWEPERAFSQQKQSQEKNPESAEIIRHVKVLMERSGHRYSVVYWRLTHGWSDQEIIETPIRVHETKNKFVFQGKAKTIFELAEISDISNTTIRNRLLCGWSVEDAVLKPVDTERTHLRRKRLRIAKDEATDAT